VGFISNQSQRLKMYRKLADGTSPAELVAEDPQRGLSEGFWSRDGRWLIYRTNPADVFARRLDSSSAAVPVLATAFDELTPALSPDGRWLAYTSAESGRIEVFVRPFPNTQSGKWQVSTAGGAEPHWSHSGRELFYVSLTGLLTVVEVVPGPTFVTGGRRDLFSTALFIGGIGSWDVTPDDRRFVMIRGGSGGSVSSELVVVENLLAELRGQARPGR
jgi:hypothetical protein